MSPAEVVAARKLGTIDQVILDRLQNGVERRDDTGVGREQHINVLYRAAFGVADADMPTNRLQQQRLGTYIKRLNEKLGPKEQVIPSRTTKRHYRLELVPVEG